jgi:serine/threonine protein kinase
MHWWNLLLYAEGKSSHVLNWIQRLSICLRVAHGLHYLHALAQPKIIHRDIKAANILLDCNFQPKIVDFGLALLFPEETSHITTMHVAGTK